MRWAAWSGASQTMVIRETSVRSDSPTVSETMLMLRRRKSEATRVRTPGLSWTRATKVWSICIPLLVQDEFVLTAAAREADFDEVWLIGLQVECGRAISRYCYAEVAVGDLEGG